VAVLALLTILKSCQALSVVFVNANSIPEINELLVASVVVWINFVEYVSVWTDNLLILTRTLFTKRYFGDLRGAVFLNFTAWWQAGNTLMVGLTVPYASPNSLSWFRRHSSASWSRPISAGAFMPYRKNGGSPPP
jgi:hypothetical protein